MLARSETPTQYSASPRRGDEVDPAQFPTSERVGDGKY